MVVFDRKLEIEAVARAKNQSAFIIYEVHAKNLSCRKIHFLSLSNLLCLGEQLISNFRAISCLEEYSKWDREPAVYRETLSCNSTMKLGNLFNFIRESQNRYTIEWLVRWEQMQRNYGSHVEAQEVQARIPVYVPLRPYHYHASLYCYLLGVWRRFAHALECILSVSGLSCAHYWPRVHDYSPGT
jgi:hypothetical protein